MKKKFILADTSLLIDFFRKKNKAQTSYFLLQRQYDIAISVITMFEFNIGALSEAQHQEYKRFLETVEVLPLTAQCIEHAVVIYTALKRRNERIGLADTLIAATASANDLHVATLNVEHFSRIPAISVVHPPEGV